LALSPDDLLLPLVQGAARFIDDKLSKKQPILGLTPSSEKVKLVVRRDDFALGKPNPWNEIFTEFGVKIKNYIGEENYQKLRGNFTTTGICQNAAYDVSLMDACQSYFSYHNMFMCGIPQINLLGTLEDWKKFQQVALQICDLLEITDWKNQLGDVINNILKCLEGQPTKENLKFWCDMYREGHHSGGNHISGWINLFFPYVKRGEEIIISENADYMKGKKGWFGGRNVTSYPAGISSAPVLCNDRGREVDLKYYSGQIGLRWNTDYQELSPAWGWCVTIKNSAS